MRAASGLAGTVAVANMGEDKAPPEEGAAEALEIEESIAEGMMSHKKLLCLSQGVSHLQKTSRAHHETVMRLERAMGDTISENDLRRAIGLALEEFDSQLVEAFRDSNRKCMSMFAKQEDVSEIQGKVDKKVNFSEYNTVLQKLSELRRYVDTMAESVFIGHQESKEEFAKEVNVDRALKLKADLVELTQVRAKLERLEAIVTANDLKQNAGLDELREQVTQSNAANIKANSDAIEQNKKLITKLNAGQASLNDRLTIAEEQIGSLTEDSAKLTQTQEEMQERQDGVIWRACQSLQGLLHNMEGKVKDLSDEMKQLHADVEKFESFSTSRFQQLFDDDEQTKEQIKFLMEASEMLKRRSREFNKSHTAQLKELSGSETKLCEQMAAIERSLKGQEREVKAVEKRLLQRLGGTGQPGGFGDDVAQETLAALVPAPPPPLDGNQHLQGVLMQLERIANISPQKLARPALGESRAISDQDATQGLPPALEKLASLAPYSASRAQGAYGLSPRVPAAGIRPAPQGPRKAARG